jgi:hypothetical protein
MSGILWENAHFVKFHQFRADEKLLLREIFPDGIGRENKA